MKSEDIHKKIQDIKKYRTLILNNEILPNLIKYVELVDRYKNSYFRTPPQQSFSRRQIELNDHVDLEFELLGDNISLFFKVDCSCKKYYISKYVIVNEEYKDVRFVKKVLKSINYGDMMTNESD